MPGSLNTLEPDEELARRIAFDGLILRGLVGCYDTKYAMHALRIGLQGVELLQTGRISLPVSEPERSMLRAVRAGDVALKEVLSESMQPPHIWSSPSPPHVCRVRAIAPESTSGS